MRARVASTAGLSRMKDRVLITGGAGFIGSHLVRVWADRGREVVVLDALIASVHGAAARSPDLGPGATFLKADVRDGEAWREALRGVNLVYHLAAETGTGESMYRSHRHVDVNLGGTARLCDVIAADPELAPRRVVLASSRAVYGEGPYRCEHCGIVCPPARDPARLRRGLWDPPCPECEGRLTPVQAAEGLRPAPTSTYGLTKAGQESLLQMLAPTHGVEVVVLRLQNVYGPGQSLRNPYTGVLSIFALLLRSGGKVHIFEDGGQTRDWVFVDDAVRALVRAGDVELNEPLVVNVGSGRSATLLGTAQQVGDALGVERVIEVTGEYRIGDVRHAVADVTALRERLGMDVEVDLATGLARFAAWVRDAELAASGLAAALEEMRESGLLRVADVGPRSEVTWRERE
ncbi:MAG: NAD-dependent epimerase/dehydratase family protein [Gemmatimonadetes bacterium]|nr:NAD-dependent epimerase/dehydratase family protein [Gemmatimonadota bacterium]